MAVVQISKIQVRRGRKLDVGSVPQLSSAEFAWAVDSQELYIGNGSIAEGAPYVGNTKILTEHDNILELTSGYTFGQSTFSITKSIARSLQSKLDETVSVIDYGAVPDGSTDCTEAFERAFDDLFNSTDENNRKVLLIPNGNYSFNDSGPLRIPSWATLRGENPKQTILNINNSGIEFVAGNNPSGYPTNIKISNLTIEHGDGQTDITASRYCEFEHVTWKSNYRLGETVFVEENANAEYLLPQVSQGGNIQIIGNGISSDITVEFNETFQQTLNLLVGILNGDPTFGPQFSASVAGTTSLKITANSPSAPASLISSNFTVIVQVDNDDNVPQIINVDAVSDTLREFQDGSQQVEASVFWNNESFSTRTTNNLFNKCSFIDTRLGIECQQKNLFDTEIDFNDCSFSICDTGIYIGGVPRLNNISQGNFWNIRDCNFENIANQAFISTHGIGTKFHRTIFKNCGNGTGTSAFPLTAIVKFGEKINNVLIDCSSDRHQSSAITELPEPTKPAIIEFENASYASLLDRNYTKIISDENDTSLAVLPIENRFVEIDYYLSLGSYSRKGKLTISLGSENDSENTAVSDDYIYSPQSISSPAGEAITNFKFSAGIENVGSIPKPTIVLRYRNPIGVNTIGTISYSLTYGN